MSDSVTTWTVAYRGCPVLYYLLKLLKFMSTEFICYAINDKVIFQSGKKNFESRISYGILYFSVFYNHNFAKQNLDIAI